MFPPTERIGTEKRALFRRSGAQELRPRRRRDADFQDLARGSRAWGLLHCRRSTSRNQMLDGVCDKQRRPFSPLK
jgi:hypothetical protein